MELLAAAQVGDLIKIIYMVGEPKYNGKVGCVTLIDDAGQIHGTWGGCAICTDEDRYMVISRPGSGDFLLWKTPDLFSEQEKDQITRRFLDEAFEDPKEGISWYTDMIMHPEKRESWLQNYCHLVFEKDFDWNGEWTKAPWSHSQLEIDGWAIGIGQTLFPMKKSYVSSLRKGILECHEMSTVIYEDSKGDFWVKTIAADKIYKFRIRVGATSAPLHYCHEVIGWDGHLPHKDKK